MVAVVLRAAPAGASLLRLAWMATAEAAGERRLLSWAEARAAEAVHVRQKQAQVLAAVEEVARSGTVAVVDALQLRSRTEVEGRQAAEAAVALQRLDPAASARAVASRLVQPVSPRSAQASRAESFAAPDYQML